MSAKSESIAQRFEAANGELIGLIEGLSDQQWKATCPGEGWSVGVTAHHVGSGHAIIAGLGAAIASGQPMPPITMEMINEGNAAHAKEYANCTRAETAELLRTAGAQAAGIVRGVSDEGLANGVESQLFGGQRMTAEAVFERILIGHVQDHLGSIRQAL